MQPLNVAEEVDDVSMINQVELDRASTSPHFYFDTYYDSTRAGKRYFKVILDSIPQVSLVL